MDEAQRLQIWMNLSKIILSKQSWRCVSSMVLWASCILVLAALEDGYLPLLRHSSVSQREIWVSYAAHIWSQSISSISSIFSLRLTLVLLCPISKSNTLQYSFDSTGHFKAGTRCVAEMETSGWDKIEALLTPGRCKQSRAGRVASLCIGTLRLVFPYLLPHLPPKPRQQFSAP